MEESLTSSSSSSVSSSSASSSSSSSKKTSRARTNLLLADAVAAAQAAVTADDQKYSSSSPSPSPSNSNIGDDVDVVVLYEVAVRRLLAVLALEPADSKRRPMLRQKVEDLLTRAEEIRDFEKKRQGQNFEHGDGAAGSSSIEQSASVSSTIDAGAVFSRPEQSLSDASATDQEPAPFMAAAHEADAVNNDFPPLGANLAEPTLPSAPPLDGGDHAPSDADSPLDSVSDDNESVPIVFCDTIFNVDGVECYSVLSAADERERIAGPSTLQVLKVRGSLGLMLFRVGDFEFPLRENIPCMRTTRGVYVVPLAVSGVCYAFVFPPQIPDAFLHAFERVVAPGCMFRAGADQHADHMHVEPMDSPLPVPASSAIPAPVASSAITASPLKSQVATVDGETRVAGVARSTANGVTVTAQVLTAGIQKGGELVATGVQKTGSFITSKVSKADKPLEVPGAVTRTVAAAKVASPAVVQLSRGLVKGLTLLAEEVGSAVANAVVAKTEKSGPGTGPLHSENAKAAKHVAKAVLIGVVDVWDALEEAGKTVLIQTRDTTVHVVDHRWGEEAAEVAGDSLDVAVDAYETVRNVKGATVKKVVKRVAKETAKTGAKNILGIDDSESSADKSAQRERLMDGQDRVDPHKLLTSVNDVE